MPHNEQHVGGHVSRMMYNMCVGNMSPRLGSVWGGLDVPSDEQHVVVTCVNG